MIAYYPMLKHLHMTLALVSLLLFAYRWSLALSGSARLQQKWLKILPHINDTFLLLLGGSAGGGLAAEPGSATLAVGQADCSGALYRSGCHGAQTSGSWPEAVGRLGCTGSVWLYGWRRSNQVALVMADVNPVRRRAFPSSFYTIGC